MPIELDTETFAKVYEETAHINRFDEWKAGFVLTVELWMCTSWLGYVVVKASWHTPKHERQPTSIALGAIVPNGETRELLRVGGPNNPAWLMANFKTQGKAVRYAVETFDLFKNHLSEWQRKEQGLLDEEERQGV